MIGDVVIVIKGWLFFFFSSLGIELFTRRLLLLGTKLSLCLLLRANINVPIK
jgi:hypothetical protein